MKHRINSVVLVVALVAGACGGDGGALSAEEYFAAVEQAGTDFAARGDAADERLADADDFVAVTKAVLPEFGDIIDDFVGVLGDLEPPEELSALHQEVMVRGREAAAKMDIVIGELTGIDDMVALIALFDGDAMIAFNEAGGQFEAACSDLQAYADEHDIVVDLSCEG
ncbi:hypothetical protein HQ535_01250 [bacterium]|nr:hypothetical protein [bacterium]